jgi:hypothetical protein
MMYTIHVITIHGNRELRWAVHRNGVEYVFADYNDAKRYYDSHK